MIGIDCKVSGNQGLIHLGMVGNIKAKYQMPREDKSMVHKVQELILKKEVTNG